MGSLDSMISGLGSPGNQASGPGPATRPAVDFSLCDNEPIHIIGSVQPHGALLAVEPATTTVTHASANIADYLGQPPAALLGRKLSDILGDEGAADILARAVEPSWPELLRPCFLSVPRPGKGAFEIECFPHRHDGRIVIELVPREHAPAAVWEEDLLRQRLITELIRPESLGELARASAEIIREVTGFDRVMIYRFAPDKHGEVIAESTVRPDSFLGLHYPASDIPDPARRHFVLNVIRSIPDINAAPAPILTKGGIAGDARSDRPLDLTFSKLRAVAPVHVEYLNNMGVGASLSISLTSNGQLWGLVACHHYAPLRLSWSRMRFCELVGGTVSALLQSLENATLLQRSIRAEKIAFDIERKARAGTALRQVIEDHADAILDMTASSGMVARLDRHTIVRGEVPPHPPDHAGLAAGIIDGVATMDHLAGLTDEAAPLSPGASGAAFLELAPDGEDYLLLLRPEFADEIRWAGKPEKLEVRLDDGRVRLSPRGSFALWREERKGRSKPFSDSDREVLRILRRALFALNSLDRERAAVRAQIAAEGEEAKLRLMLLDASRDRALGEMATALAHELNQPLSAVVNYVNACRQELRNYKIPAQAGLNGLMDSAVFESTRAADLVRRLRNFITHGEIDLTHFDIALIVRQSVDLALAATKQAPPAVRFEFDPANRIVWADPVQVSQVILNLVRNSMSALAGQNAPEFVIASRREGSLLEISVSDNGPGIPEDLRATLFEPFHRSTTSGMGIGLSLCRSIVEAHGGRIWFRDTARGADIVFTLQLDPYAAMGNRADEA